MDNGQIVSGGADLALAEPVIRGSSKESSSSGRRRRSATSKTSTFRVGKVRGDRAH
jgi:hypothetical protein